MFLNILAGVVTKVSVLAGILGEDRREILGVLMGRGHGEEGSLLKPVVFKGKVEEKSVQFRLLLGRVEMRRRNLVAGWESLKV